MRHTVLIIAVIFAGYVSASIIEQNMKPKFNCKPNAVFNKICTK